MYYAVIFGTNLDCSHLAALSASGASWVTSGRCAWCNEETARCPTGQQGYYELTTGAVSYCYYVSQDRRTWFSARQACKSLSADADLATIHNEDVRTVLKERYLRDEKYWIGLVGLVWYWINGMTTLGVKRLLIVCRYKAVKLECVVKTFMKSLRR